MAWEYMPAKTEDVFHRLTEAAREMRVVTCGDLGHDVGLAPVGLGKPLGYIRDQVCRARGLPWLTAIAVARNGLPGEGFLDNGMSLGGPDDFRTWWKAMVLCVYATDWSTVELRPGLEARGVGGDRRTGSASPLRARNGS